MYDCMCIYYIQLCNTWVPDYSIFTKFHVRVYPGGRVQNYCNDALQVLMVNLQLLLSVVQLVHQLVDLLMHLTIPY